MAGVAAVHRLAVACLAVAALLGCGQSRPLSTVLLVSIEGLRGDRLSGAGYPRPTSPFIDSLAQRSAVFTRSYTGASPDLASHASLLTGLSPAEHGLWTGEQSLRPDVATLAERFAERGYTTAAFTSTRLDWQAVGLVRGFDHLDSPGDLYARPYRRAAGTVGAAAAWLAQQTDQPAFVWIQLEDPTQPLDPPGAQLEAATRGSNPVELVDYLLREQHVPLGYFAYQRTRILKLVNRYDGEVRAVDDALAELYGALGAGGGERALWVVTGANGMGLGNHAWEGATRQLYEVNVRVPLVVHTPGGLVPAGTHEGVVSQLALGGALLALVDGTQTPVEELLAADSGAFVQRGSLGSLPRGASQLGVPRADPRQQDAWVEGRWKLIRGDAGDEQLYDVAEDRYETRERSGDAPDGVLERMRAGLAAQQAARGIASTPAAPGP